MRVYAVFKEGVYRHECAGIFTSEDRAKQVADAWLAKGDGYHEWHVVPFEMDVVNETLRPGYEGDWIDEPMAIYVATKTIAPKPRSKRKG